MYYIWYLGRFNQVDLVILNLNEVCDNSIAYNQILVLSVVKLLYTVLVLIRNYFYRERYLSRVQELMHALFLQLRVQTYYHLEVIYL